MCGVHPRPRLGDARVFQHRGWRRNTWPKPERPHRLRPLRPDETAALFGLELLAQGRERISQVNTTRFRGFLPGAASAGSRTATHGQRAFHPGVHHASNEAGALAQPLNIIGAHDFNMRNLRSRPMKNLIWNYYFFVEAEGNISSVRAVRICSENFQPCAHG